MKKFLIDPRLWNKELRNVLEELNDGAPRYRCQQVDPVLPKNWIRSKDYSRYINALRLLLENK